MAPSTQSVPIGQLPEDWQDRLLPRLLREFPNVLLVDDSKFFADILATFFKLEGFTARVAYGGMEALDALKLETPDIAFLDIVMPDLSGLEIARRLRASNAPKIPLLVALSGWDEEEHRNDAAEAGFDHFMIKPVDPSSLREFLGKLVQAS